MAIKPKEETITEAKVEESSQAQGVDVQFLNIPGQLDDQAAAEQTEPADGTHPGDQPGENIISEEMAAGILRAPFAVAAAYLGPHWELTDTEVKIMQPPASKVFSDLFGQYVHSHPEAYMLGFVLLTCIGSRAAVTIKEQREKESRAVMMPVPEVGEVSC